MLSRYPFIIRAFPGESVIGVIQPLFALHVTLAVVALPASSTSTRGVLRAAPTALFQPVCGTTPAVSVAAMRDVLVPRKLIPIARGIGGAVGTIWMPLIGALTFVFVLVPGVAVIVKAVLCILNLT
jgi:hypothetical protein